MQYLDNHFEYPFQNPSLSEEERIDILLALMTLDEKVAALGTDPSVPRLGVAGTDHAEGLHGLAMGGPGDWGKPNVIRTTTFPQEIGLAETWDAEAVRTVASIEAHEARWIAQSAPYLRSQLVIRAPNADLGRDPRWGRTEECYGEDAYFNGTMTQAFVRGLQGDHPKYWLAASLMKHFLANSNENGRERTSSDFDERLYREYYSVPFRMGIEAGSRAFMAAYNRYNGIPCAVHPMLEDVARNEWGNDGIICTDGGAMKLLVDEHKYVATYAEACADIIKAGIGQFLDDHVEPTKQALDDGLISEGDIDLALRGNFRVMIRLGLLDPPESVPYSQIKGSEEPWLTDRHKDAVRDVTCKSIVLLKNSDKLLPLNAGDVQSIAVIGRLAGEVFLDWYSGTPPYAVTPLDGIKNKVGPNVAVRYTNGSDVAAAVELARNSDVVILCAGNHPVGDGGWAKVTRPDYGKESVDRESLTLPEERDLIEPVLAANPRTVVVLISSFPYTINWADKHAPAILHMTHNSQEMGNALADVIFGDYNPAGRLVQTWPKSVDDLPPMMDYDIRHGRTYMYAAAEPLYAFGYGLSYTSFDVSQLRTSGEVISEDKPLRVSVNVKNTGGCDGDEVVQVYAEYIDSAVERPRRQLVGFKRVFVPTGHTVEVSLTVLPAQLAYWNCERHRFVFERDKQVRLLVGSSSSNISLSTVLTTESFDHDMDGAHEDLNRSAVRSIDPVAA